jgi:hypothetical protein
MSERADLYWCYRPDLDGRGPYTIHIVRAESHEAACAEFVEPRYSNKVHELTTPALVERARFLGPEDLMDVVVSRLPSSYDQFGTGRDHDYGAMEDRGYEVR